MGAAAIADDWKMQSARVYLNLAVHASWHLNSRPVGTVQGYTGAEDACRCELSSCRPYGFHVDIVGIGRLDLVC
jgi:hypothetical protein